MFDNNRFANGIFYLATKTAGKNFGPNNRAYKIKQDFGTLL